MIPDYLAPYLESMSTQRERELAAALLQWSLELCSCERGPEWHARRAYYSAAFEARCAPTDATVSECLVPAEFLAFFWSADDGSAQDLEAFGASTPEGHDSELRAFYRALLADMHAHELPTADFEAEVADFVSALRDEAHLADSDGISLQQFHELRMRTVGVRPYVMCWRTIRGMGPLSRGSAADTLLDLAVEAIYLGNDLGSLSKEAHDPGARKTNWVLFHADAIGGVDAAVAAAVDRYNHIIPHFADQTDDFAELLRGILRGNAAAHTALVGTRYPGADDVMRPLLSVDDVRPRRGQVS